MLAVKTTHVDTNIDLVDNSFVGTPLVLSTGSSVPGPETSCLSHHECGAGFCNSSQCGNGVAASDILLAPEPGGAIRFAADLQPVRGDLRIRPEQRIVVRRHSGAVGTGFASFLLSNTHLMILNSEGAACVAACRAGK